VILDRFFPIMGSVYEKLLAPCNLNGLILAYARKTSAK
jgi:hypothetical protein